MSDFVLYLVCYEVTIEWKFWFAGEISSKPIEISFLGKFDREPISFRYVVKSSCIENNQLWIRFPGFVSKIYQKIGKIPSFASCKRKDAL